MGMFDSVYAECPTCGKKMEFQSKAGPCNLNKYHFTSVPGPVAAELEADRERGTDWNECCGKKWNLQAHVPRVVMTLVEWKDPDADDFVDEDGPWDGRTYD